MTIETTHASDVAQPYDVKIPVSPPDSKAAERIVDALRKWAKRHAAK